MIEDWNSYRRQLVETIAKIAELSPNGEGLQLSGGSEFENETPRSQMRELIALAGACDYSAQGVLGLLSSHNDQEEELCQ